MEAQIAKRELNLGDVKAKSTTLRSLKLDKPTHKISTSCGCTAAKAQNNVLVIQYNAPEIPRHLVILGHTTMDVSKQITIAYKDNTKEIITLKAKVVL